AGRPLRCGRHALRGRHRDSSTDRRAARLPSWSRGRLRTPESESRLNGRMDHRRGQGAWRDPNVPRLPQKCRWSLIAAHEDVQAIVIEGRRQAWLTQSRPTSVPWSWRSSLGRKPRAGFRRGLRARRKGCRRLGSARRWRLLVRAGGELLADLQPVELPELLGQAHVVKPLVGRREVCNLGAEIDRQATRRWLSTVSVAQLGPPRRMASCAAATPGRLVIRLSSAALPRPARASSLRLIVKVSMGQDTFTEQLPQGIFMLHQHGEPRNLTPRGLRPQSVARGTRGVSRHMASNVARGTLETPR